MHAGVVDSYDEGGVRLATVLNPMALKPLYSVTNL